MVTIAHVEATDVLSGLAALKVWVSNDELTHGDVVIDGGSVRVRAGRKGNGDGRTYSVLATATDIAGNVTIRRGSCTVPHDRGPRLSQRGMCSDQSRCETCSSPSYAVTSILTS